MFIFYELNFMFIMLLYNNMNTYNLLLIKKKHFI